MADGMVILLNGSSSSGKTSIAQALRDMGPKPAFYVGVDHFNAMRPGWATGDEAVSEGLAMNRALHGTVAVLAKNGWDVILEHVLVNRLYLKDCIEQLGELPVLFVGVLCPLEVLERRERARGDRTIGIAREQIERVHAHGVYDIEVDTSLHDPVECALQIQQRLAHEHLFTAVRELKNSLPS